MMILDSRLNLSDDLLCYTDKISMHFSIETRVPVLDLELVRFIDSLPYQYKVRVGEGKYIHKKFAEKVLGSEIIKRKKKGFGSPTRKWFKGKNGENYLEMLTSNNAKITTFIDEGMIKETFKNHNLGFNKEKQLFTFIALHYFLEENARK